MRDKRVTGIDKVLSRCFIFKSVFQCGSIVWHYIQIVTAMEENCRKECKNKY
ncbi:hypothetical protein M075_0243 [Bacteroides fragilis str. 20793-3]|nr:hypothetical protein M075_0243 [Bacteroides fragilis str. 20793-3]